MGKAHVTDMTVTTKTGSRVTSHSIGREVKITYKKKNTLCVCRRCVHGCAVVGAK